jgi:lysozyme family protein
MFDKAVTRVLQWEGKYSNDPHDKGGKTNYGISAAAYPGVDIKNLTETRAREIYRRDYWNKCNCDKMPYPVALIVFDSAVNQGVSTAARMLQKCLDVEIDGAIGPQTIAACRYRDTVIKFAAERIYRYTHCSGWERYGIGWTRRVADMIIGGAE